MKPIAIAAAFSLITFTMCTSNEKKESVTTITVNDSLTGEKNKELILRVYAEMVNKRNLSLIDSFFDSKIVDHAAFPGQAQGIEGFRKAVGDLFALFSHMQVTVDDLIAGDNIVASHETWNVTTASGNKTATGKTMHIFKISKGKITDEWSKGWEWLENL
jgi:predicted ester cyclase